MVEQEFMAIPMGEEIIYEFMMYSLGVPLSKKYMPTMFSVIFERMVRMFKAFLEQVSRLCENIKENSLKNNEKLNGFVL